MSTPRPRSRATLLFAAAVALLLVLCRYGGTFGLIGARPLRLPGLGDVPAGQFVLLLAATWLASLGVMLTWPRGLSRARTTGLMLALALACRLLLLSHEPSDDVNRYLWEGKVLNAGISPYAGEPTHPQLADLARDDPFHAHINHPDLPAAYPPLVIEIFALVGRTWYSPFAVKLILIAFDLLALCCVIDMLAHRRLALPWAALYAFNPVVLYAIAGQAHFDAFQLAFLAAAVCSYDRRRWFSCFLLLGLAVQAKYVAVLTVPFFLRRDNWRYLAVTAAAVLVPYVPIMLIDSRQLFYCLVRFGETFAFNGAVHGLLLGIFGGRLAPATLTAKILLALALLTGYLTFHPDRNPRYRDDPVSGCFFALGALLVLSPTVHAWYLTWIIPFLCVRPMASWLILTLTGSLYFMTIGVAHFTGAWALPRWAQILEWLPFGLLLLREGVLLLRRSRSRIPSHPPESVSVIIPVLNEADAIQSCVGAALGDPCVTEAIVVDGGSTDDTAARAQQAGAHVIVHDAPVEQGGGRGGQILAGVRQAAGDVVAVVHADTIVNAPALSNAVAMLQRQPMVVGGAIGSCFSDSSWWTTLLTVANDAKAALAGISFGDQVQFFLRRPVHDADAFPDIPLMEDVELALRLPRLGARVYLFGDAAVTPRRWKSHKLRRASMIIRICSGYLLRRPFGRPDARAIYRKYYG